MAAFHTTVSHQMSDSAPRNPACQGKSRGERKPVLRLSGTLQSGPLGLEPNEPRKNEAVVLLRSAVCLQAGDLSW